MKYIDLETNTLHMSLLRNEKQHIHKLNQLESEDDETAFSGAAELVHKRFATSMTEMSDAAKRFKSSQGHGHQMNQFPVPFSHSQSRARSNSNSPRASPSSSTSPPNSSSSTNTRFAAFIPNRLNITGI